MLWNKNFFLLIMANFLLFVGVFMLFPLLGRLLEQDWKCSYFTVGMVMMVFVPAMFLPGVFSNYLVDTFSRKHVCTRSIALFVLSGLLYPHVPHMWVVVAIWILQGIFFSIALMGTGSTLVIDVTPSHKRNDANRIFSWSGLLGVPCGLFLECYSTHFFPLEQQLYLSLALCLVAAILISGVHVSFRAPLDLPLCSFDRFILFRTLPPGMNMFLGAFALGLIFTSMSAMEFVGVIIGFAMYWILRRVNRRPMNGRLQILVGQLFILLAIGMYLLFGKQPTAPSCIAAALAGFGTICSLGQFLCVMILLPMHCERGTGFQTFQLLWNAGLIGGFSVSFVCKYYLISWQTIYIWAALLVVVACLLYQAYIHRYFKKHYQQH